jgi:hypothetical protein
MVCSETVAALTVFLGDIDPQIALDIVCIANARVSAAQIYHEVLSAEVLPVAARVSAILCPC